jgi:hypothetical protein
VFPLVQFGVVCIVVAYLTQYGRYCRRRNRQSWDEITGQIRTDAGVWAQFHHARLVMEMCDYAEAHGAIQLGELIALRTDAMQVRASVLTAWTTKRPQA